jgi:magnesium chelatase subunit D
VIGSRAPGPGEALSDPDLAASFIAALNRGAASDRLRIEPQDIRLHVRREEPGTFVLFLLDTSDSMGALERMAVTKGAVLALLQRSYQERHVVALTTFGGGGAKTTLAPTKSVLLAKKALNALRPDGGTPLAAGIEACGELFSSAGRRYPGMRKILVIISDGEANIARERGVPPLRDALEAANRLRRSDIHAVLIDTKLPKVGKENEMKSLHRVIGGRYINASAPGLEAILEAVDAS